MKINYALEILCDYKYSYYVTTVQPPHASKELFAEFTYNVTPLHDCRILNLQAFMKCLNFELHEKDLTQRLNVEIVNLLKMTISTKDP